jgi:hypothetical protein
MIRNSLTEIIDDIVNIFRNNQPADEDQYSRKQIEFWVHQYRALFIKQDIDKGRDINESYMQTINGLKLIVEDYGANTGQDTKVYRYRTSEKIPTPLDLHFGRSFVVYTMTDDEIQVMAESRAALQRYRKFTAEAPRCYYTDGYIYIEGCSLLEYIKVKGVFENPIEVAGLSLEEGKCYDPSAEPYPVPANMIPVIRQTILTRELNIMQQQASDQENDASNQLTSPQGNNSMPLLRQNQVQ